MAPKSGPKPTTLSACLARAGFPQQLDAGEAERTISEVRRIAKSSKAQVLSEEQLLSQLLRPVANLLLEFVPNFSSAPASSRLRFWRDAASVALGRTKAGVAYKQWLQTDAILTAAEHDLLTETLELPPNRKRPLQGDAKGEPEPAAKRLCGSSSSGPSNSDPEALRRKQEMAETVRNCQEDLEALRATQAKDLEIFLEREERSMANRRAQFHQTQADQVDQMQRQNMQIVADLRAQHLKELFSPCLWISSGDVQPWHGFYTLSTEDSTDTSPVYCKYNSSTPFLYAAKGSWCFSKNRANLLTKTGCGFVRSSAADAAPSVLLATGWRQLGEDKAWASIDLQIQEVQSTVEFVIVSLAGEEILRKSCVLSETVHHLRKQLQAARQSHDNVQLCLQNTRLRKSTPLGCLSLRPGETLQAIFGLRSCIACKTPITGPPSRCGSCARCHCAACARGLTRCRICGKRVCKACTASTAGWLFAGMCPRCARPWGL
ncbi:unnamed protein product [Symbiodinium sp. CCMP2592]|nr:unnamed protein product [Symbiodinium sp. CCMP2592]